MSIPFYNAKNEYIDIKPGLYLGLFHGFVSKEERDRADEWGHNGPLIGPLKFVHTTYGDHIKAEFECPVDAEKYGFDVNKPYIFCIEGPATEENPDRDEGCIEYRGMYYGDWTVFNIK